MKIYSEPQNLNHQIYVFLFKKSSIFGKSKNLDSIFVAHLRFLVLKIFSIVNFKKVLPKCPPKTLYGLAKGFTLQYRGHLGRTF